MNLNPLPFLARIPAWVPLAIGAVLPPAVIIGACALIRLTSSPSLHHAADMAVLLAIPVGFSFAAWGADKM